MTVLLVAALILSATPLLAGRNQAEDIWEQADKAAQAGRHQEAIGLYRRSLALCGRQEYDCQSSNYNGMGTAYDALNQNQQALDNYRAGLRIDRQRDSKPDIALALINIGAVLYKGWKGMPRLCLCWRNPLACTARWANRKRSRWC